MEVGPLSRMLVAYASGHPRVKELVGARAREARRRARGALLDARPRRRARDRDAAARRADGGHGSTSWPRTWRAATCGSTTTRSGIPPPGRATAPGPASTRRRAARSATGCTSRTARSRTTSASCRAPGTPGRATPSGQRGPYEEALVGTPVADAEQPLEILRTIHSFDPCIACGVHVVDAQEAARSSRVRVS